MTKKTVNCTTLYFFANFLVQNIQMLHCAAITWCGIYKCCIVQQLSCAEYTNGTELCCIYLVQDIQMLHRAAITWCGIYKCCIVQQVPCAEYTNTALSAIALCGRYKRH